MLFIPIKMFYSTFSTARVQHIIFYSQIRLLSGPAGPVSGSLRGKECPEPQSLNKVTVNVSCLKVTKLNKMSI